MTKLSIKKFKIALPGSHGVQALIAKKCGVERSTITNFLDKHPEMRKLCLLEREKIIDVSENRLFKAADNGEKWAIDKILSTIGKGRGYITSQENIHSGQIDNKWEIEVIETQRKEDEKIKDNSSV